MKKERQPESGELIWNLRVEERQQATHVIHAGHLEETEQTRTFTLVVMVTDEWPSTGVNRSRARTLEGLREGLWKCESRGALILGRIE